MSLIILDIDNCIADDAWRIPRIDWKQTDPNKRYHDYHLLAPFDRDRNHTLFTAVQALVLTSRPLAYRAATEEWLYRAGVTVKHLLMRNNSDSRSSVDVKRAQVLWLTSLYDIALSDIEAAYDDRPDIIAMYTQMGVPNAQVVAIHNVSAYQEEDHGQGQKATA